MAESALVDLVCGPASPLPETYQRYRLVARIGSGGQADVYRGVRLCGGVTSAPITVKVFRIDSRRPLADELRSWDKGDAALMDLNNRGVTGICRRADGFYGPPPHPSGAAPSVRDAVPYQIYDYLHGVNLREYVTSGAGRSGLRLHAGTTLYTLAETIRALHHPAEPGACPVLHMDIKPSNLMVLTNGDVRLIDFTGARYWRHEEITQIAYTPESGGPEALRGEVAPSYDVHGFGAVAFFMLTGAPPRGSAAPPMERHPLFNDRPALRDHLLAPLADRPSSRPSTLELTSWIDRLMVVVRASRVPDLGLDWSEAPTHPIGVPADARRAVGRAKPVLAGTETDAFLRIEALERELVELRGYAATAPQLDLQVMPAVLTPAGFLPPISGQPASPGRASVLDPAGPTATGPTVTSPTAVPVSSLPISGPPISGPPVSGPPEVSMLVGRAAVVPRTPRVDQTGYAVDAPRPAALVRQQRGDRFRTLRRGGSWSVTGGVFSLICWIIWATANRSTAGLYLAPTLFILSISVAVGVFIVLRLLGRLVIEGWMHRMRRGARGAHIGTAVFLIAVGVTYLQQTAWIMTAVHWMNGLS